MSEVTATREWSQGWTLVMAAAFGMALSSVGVYMVGVFIDPLEKEFGWSRASISAGLMMLSVIGVSSAPFIGILVDRLGPRRIGVLGVTAYCLCIASLCFTTSSIWSWWGLWLLFACAAAGIKPTIWTAGVSSMFNKGRGLALSAVLCGTGLGSSLTPLVSNWLIDHYGWRMAFAALGLFWGVIVIPPVFFFFSSAKDRQRTKATPDTAPLVLTGLGVREGLLSVTFAKLAIAAFVTSLVVVSFVSNLVPILSSKDISRGEAAGIAGIVGMTTVFGRLTGGYLLDRISGSLVGGFSVSLPIIPALLLLFFPGDTTVAFVSALVLGLSLGIELDAVAYLSTRHFGLRNFGVLFGTISGLLSLSTGLGPLLVNIVYDQTQSYDVALIAYIPLCMLAAVMFFTLGRYPVFELPEKTDG